MSFFLSQAFPLGVRNQSRHKAAGIPIIPNIKMLPIIFPPSCCKKKQIQREYSTNTTTLSLLTVAKRIVQNRTSDFSAAKPLAAPFSRYTLSAGSMALALFHLQTGTLLFRRQRFGSDPAYLNRKVKTCVWFPVSCCSFPF